MEWDEMVCNENGVEWNEMKYNENETKKSKNGIK